jgi:hypothetical protein
MLSACPFGAQKETFARIRSYSSGISRCAKRRQVGRHLILIDAGLSFEPGFHGECRPSSDELRGRFARLFETTRLFLDHHKVAETVTGQPGVIGSKSPHRIVSATGQAVGVTKHPL